MGLGYIFGLARMNLFMIILFLIFNFNVFQKMAHKFNSKPKVKDKRMKGNIKV